MTWTSFLAGGMCGIAVGYLAGFYLQGLWFQKRIAKMERTYAKFIATLIDALRAMEYDDIADQAERAQREAGL